MPSLADIVVPAQTAVITMELQRGVTGDLAAMVSLAEQVKAAGVIDNVRRLCAGARSAGANVVHSTASYRPDGRGSKVNCRIQAAAIKLNQGRLNQDHPGVEVMPEIDPQPSDFICDRITGMTPFVNTQLDQILRNIGVTTIVATGNSVNIGVFGLVVNAVDLGYQVVVPRDAVAGVPKEYADAVIENSLSMLSTITTTDELLAVWA